MKTLALPLLFLPFQGNGDYFPLKEGNLWSYRAILLEGDKKSELAAVTRVEGRKRIGETECFVVEVKVGGAVSREYFSTDGSGVRVLGGRQGEEDFLYDTPILRLKYPLGKEVSWEGKTHRGGATVAYRTWVAGEEDVEVAAGRYHAFKVAVEMESPAGKTESCSWYAPGVGLVKQWARQSNAVSVLELTVDLKGFERGK